jgi:hypothetical protein
MWMKIRARRLLFSAWFLYLLEIFSTSNLSVLGAVFGCQLLVQVLGYFYSWGFIISNKQTNKDKTFPKMKTSLTMQKTSSTQRMTKFDKALFFRFS